MCPLTKRLGISELASDFIGTIFSPSKGAVERTKDKDILCQSAPIPRGRIHVEPVTLIPSPRD